jgi:pilus assembly protein CpaB
MGALARLLALAVFLLGGGAALVLYRNDDASAPPPPPPMAQVRIAATPLTVGTFLDPDDAPFTAMPLAEVRDGYIVEGQQDVIGAVIIAPTPAGEPVRRTALLTPGQEGFLAAVLRPGTRAVSVGVDAVSGNAGLIFPGDRVDVVLTQRLDGSVGGDDPALRWGAETILRDVRVIAVDQNLKTDLSARDEAGVARTVTFEVSPAEAEIIAVARNLGALSLTLRSLIVEGAPETSADGPAPTWAGDVSAVLREATGRRTADAPAMVGEFPRAPSTSEPDVRRVLVLRGTSSNAVEENPQ